MKSGTLHIATKLKDGIVSLASPQVSNTTVSVSATTTLTVVLLANKFLGCDTASYLAMLQLLGYAGLSMHQFGWNNSLQLVSTNTAALYNYTKAKFADTPAPAKAEQEQKTNHPGLKLA